MEETEGKSSRMRWGLGKVNRVNKTFRHEETLFVQGNQVRADQNKPLFCLSLFEVCLDKYELYYLGRIEFLHLEMPYSVHPHQGV